MDNYKNILEIASRHRHTYQGVKNCITSRQEFLIILVLEGFADNILQARILVYDRFLIEAWKKNDIDFFVKGNKQIPILI